MGLDTVDEEEIRPVFIIFVSKPVPNQVDSIGRTGVYLIMQDIIVLRPYLGILPGWSGDKIVLFKAASRVGLILVNPGVVAKSHCLIACGS